ncbi:MAG TPA: hypothetical protein DCQ83_03140 [Fibrobacteres bacterium]|jgi:hypothetical protein|nr:hypothetical protein [Fibrobacterota bacterium]
MSLPRVRQFPRRFLAAAALLLGACISDGPDQTGLDYVQSQGVQLSTPLYHVTFTHFPVDSMFATELPLSHFGESLLVVGRDGPFRATARMGYQLNTKAIRDSLANGLNLRLYALPRTITGGSALKSMSTGRDSVTLLIQSFAWNDTSGRAYSDSLVSLHRRILTSYSPFSTLDTTFIVKDTARIALAAAFADSNADTLQVCALNNLRKRIMTDTITAHNWLAFVEVSPLGTRDSGMYRFIAEGGTSASNYTAYDAALLLGTYAKNGANTPTALSPYPTGGRPSVNYQVLHSGSSRSLLYGVSRGVNFRLNRGRLLDSIQARLGANFPVTAANKYDARFFVPYAEINLPLADSLARVDGRFALDMQLYSEADSSDPLADTALAPVRLNDSLKLYPAQSGASSYGSANDTMICKYRKHPVDGGQRQLIVYWRTDVSVQDTFLLTPDGKRHELGLRRHTGWQRYATLGVYPKDSSADVEVYFNLSGGMEPNSFIDPATGQVKTVYADLKQRYWRPGVSLLNLRATHSIGNLLNRVGGAKPEMFLKPAERMAFDTAQTSTGSYLRVYYPVLGDIDFPRENGKLYVNVDVYLYPLRSSP